MQKKFIASLLVLTSAAFADVNMRDAAYFKTVSDFSNPLMEKTYNSRSLHTGAFGFGWCSRFETKLQILNGDKALLKECDRHRRVHVENKQGVWIYRNLIGLHTFDPQGRLLSVDGTQLFYDSSGKVTSLKSASETLNFFYQTDGSHIQKITSNHKKTVFYKYQEENLVRIESGSQVLKFQYDAFHNLLEVRSSKQTENITYDTDKDEVRSYKTSSSPCQFQFQFRKIASDELQSTAERICPSQSSQKKIFSFKARSTFLGPSQIQDFRVSGGFNDKTNLP